MLQCRRRHYKLRDHLLIIASFIIPTFIKSSHNTIETKYELLPLTKNYIQSKLLSHPKIYKMIKNRVKEFREDSENLERKRKQNRNQYDIKTKSEEEKIALMEAIKAHQRYQVDDYNGAVEAFKRAIKYAPNFSIIYSWWAMMESKIGFYEKANELIGKAINLNPNDSKLWFDWGNIEKQGQNYDKAYEYMKKALNLSPDDHHILMALGDIEKRRGNFAEADILFRKVLNRRFLDKRSRTICYINISENLLRWIRSLSEDLSVREIIEKLKEAFQFASSAIELDKNDIRARNSFLDVFTDLAKQLLRTEDLENAMPYFNTAITQKPTLLKERKINEACCYYLTIELLKSGRLEEAKKYYNMGKEALIPNSIFSQKYKELGKEFSQKRFKGKLFNIVSKRGYGFIELKGKTNEKVFLHISEISPRISTDEFELIKGSYFSFIVEKTEKGLVAKKAHLIQEEEKEKEKK